MYSFASVEKRWCDEWEKEKVFEANVSKKEKKFITAAFPYPNSPQHIGHARTYTTTDIYARYLRLLGFNVLFPMGFHVTGTPILAMAERIKEGDREILEIFEKIYGIPPEKAKSLTKPEDLVMYFSKEIETGMREMGFSIDWRRKFYTFDKHFNKFIEWQFRKLKERGLLMKGEHPVPWSEKLNSAVGAHDTKGDIDPELEEVVGIKFRFEDGFMVVATYRPETLYGVTNLWINPNAAYVKVRTDDEFWYIAKDAYESLKHQKAMEIVEEKQSEYFIKKTCVSPLGDEVPIYPATFVDPAEGTGAVMSVPAHAPLDYLAMRDLGIEELKQVIEVKGFGKYPAKEVVEKLGVKNQNDPKAEEATKIVYKAEAHEGRMVVSPYAGMLAIEAKERIKEDLINEGNAFTFWHIANGPIFSRAGDRVFVKIVKDQWFINYGDPEWKEKAKEWMNRMSVIPEDERKDMLMAIDWFKQKACTRARGLGTEFPFEKGQMIEALSDSTLYMMFYTISHRIKDIPSEELTEEFFDTLFFGKGKNKKALELREEFEYWYPLDSRHSATDLIKNHLPFFVLNHVAVLPERYWPKQIVVNGFVLMEGKKMSKSMGNILPLRRAVKEYGADVIRLSVVSGAELLQDTDFNKTVAEGIKSRLSFFFELLRYAKSSDRSRAGRWLLSRMHRKLKNARSLYEKFELRELALDWFYEMHKEILWYLKRSSSPGLKEFFEVWPIVVSPFIPFFSEEVWHQLGKKTFVSLERFPSADEGMIDDGLEKAEEVIVSVRDDIENISKIIGKRPARIYVYVASENKRKAYEILREKKNIGEFMKSAKGIMPPDVLQQMAKALMKKVHSLPPSIPFNLEFEHIKDAREFLSKEFGAEVFVLSEEEGRHEKARQALPLKPAIVIE
ncbi:MAG: leucine--tRNA ligase [Candidatus Anstonellales archaeon]